jgi:hypothetical protein
VAKRWTDEHQEEIVEIIGQATNGPIAFVASLGVLGGAALISTISLSHRGPLIYLPYAAIILTTAFYLRSEHVQAFGTRFAMALGAFMLATVILYLFIGLYAAKTLFVISLSGHAWRLAFMFAIGAVLSAAVAQLTATRPS